MKLQKHGAKSATADSCFSMIGPSQCSAALGGPATSTVDLRHQGTLNKLGSPKAVVLYCIIAALNFTNTVYEPSLRSMGIIAGWHMLNT